MKEETYKQYLDRMFESAKKVGAAQERLKDRKQEKCNEEDIHITIRKDGFQVYQNNKTFICQNGEQLVNYLGKISLSQFQLLELYKSLLLECMRKGIDFPTHLI